MRSCLFILSVSLFACINSTAQSGKKPYIIYSISGPGCRCVELTQNSYGFELKKVDEGLSPKMMRHNRRVEKKLNKRNGLGWREQMGVLIGKCLQEL